MNSQTENAEFSSRNDFEDYWKPRLFPELVSNRKRPPEYTANTGGWVRADSVSWNSAYTEFLCPEELWELRNSGALLRDWEEALPWIYMEYSWDYIIKSLNGINLLKVK
jgi:subtilase family serine protease